MSTCTCPPICRRCAAQAARRRYTAVTINDIPLPTPERMREVRAVLAATKERKEARA